MKKVVFVLAICFVLTILYIVWSQISNPTQEELNESSFSLLPASPLDATYLHEGENLTFENGEYNDDQYTVVTITEPVYGDIDGNGVNDAVFLFTDASEAGEDGIYLAVALKDDTGFLGLQTVPLEVENEPTVNIRDEIISIQTAESVPVYYVLIGTTLQAYDTNEVLTRGTFVFEDEQQTFTPCNSDTIYWISPTSSALPVLASIYTERVRTVESMRSVYAVVAGYEIAVPTDGIGAEYDEAYEISAVVKAPMAGQCEIVEEQIETATST